VEQVGTRVILHTKPISKNHKTTIILATAPALGYKQNMSKYTTPQIEVVKSWLLAMDMKEVTRIIEQLQEELIQLSEELEYAKEHLRIINYNKIMEIERFKLRDKDIE
jgi:hypothetical protein